ncbi:MAG: hypothetical protein Kow0092_29980 [Deferrisomatales bacterium]
MEIVEGRTYRIVVRFPWGERAEMTSDRVVREADGTVRWAAAEGYAFEPCLDGVIREEGTWVMGWAGGCGDVTVVISQGPGAPEP